MAHDGKYAKLITVCCPEIRGTAVCHLDAECSTCMFALKYEIEKYLKTVSEAFGAVSEATPEQIKRLSDSYQKYGKPVCLYKVHVPGITDMEDVFCPGLNCRKDIEQNGVCHCGIMKKKVNA